MMYTLYVGQYAIIMIVFGVLFKLSVHEILFSPACSVLGDIRSTGGDSAAGHLMLLLLRLHLLFLPRREGKRHQVQEIEMHMWCSIACHYCAHSVGLMRIFH